MRGILIAALITGVARIGDAQAAAPSITCDAVDRDSTAGVVDSVFRRCAVDEPARLRRSARPSFAFREQYPCATVEVEFIVGTNGRPVVGSARVVRTNSDAFASHVIRTLAQWRYAPARRGGRAVAQLVRERYSLTDIPGAAPPAEATRSSRREVSPCG